MPTSVPKAPLAPLTLLMRKVSSYATGRYGNAMLARLVVSGSGLGAIPLLYQTGNLLLRPGSV